MHHLSKLKRKTDASKSLICGGASQYLVLLDEAKLLVYLEKCKTIGDMVFWRKIGLQQPKQDTQAVGETASLKQLFARCTLHLSKY